MFVMGNSTAQAIAAIGIIFKVGSNGDIEGGKVRADITWVPYAGLAYGSTTGDQSIRDARQPIHHLDSEHREPIDISLVPGELI